MTDQQGAHQSTEQKRATVAYRCVVEARKAKDSVDEYAGFAIALPMMIRKNGLGQALAFLAGKMRTKSPDAPDKRENASAAAARRLLNDLGQRAQGPLQLQKPPAPEQLIQELLSKSSRTYRRCENELSAFATWLKRFAEAFLSEDALKLQENSNA